MIELDFIKSARAGAIEKCSRWLAEEPVYIDTETTGLSTTSEIVEIAVVSSDGYPVLNTMVKPVGPISPEASQITGITAETVRDAPTFEDIWPFLRAYLRGKTIITYNAAYDIRLIQQSLAAVGYQDQWLRAYQTWQPQCAMTAFAEFYGEWNEYHGSFRWQNLARAGNHFGIKFEGKPHSALADTLMSFRIVHHIAHSE